LEQQAKERLTGGAILVVLLVLLVPELLTGPHPVLPPVAAQPDQAPLRSYTMDLGESPRTNSGPVTASTTAPQASEPAQVSAPRAAAGSAPPAVPPTTTPVTPTTHPATHAARAEAAVPSPAPPHGAAATWTVQLGTFGNRENAARLVATLKAHGFNASVSEATRSGHKLFRVRVGAERDRAAAQKLQARLRAAGEKGGEIVPR
jgi:DedD protein